MDYLAGAQAQEPIGGRRSEAAITPRDVKEARRDLGRQLAAWREAAGLIQVDLARTIGYSRSTIANVETGRQNIPRECWEKADLHLAAAGSLLNAFDQVDTLVRDYHTQMARAREQQHPQRTASDRARSHPGTGSQDTLDGHRCGCALTVARWGAREARALREALRLTIRAFAEYLAVTTSTVSGWERRQRAQPLRLATQDLLDQALKSADGDTRARFWQLLSSHDNATTACPACRRSPSSGPAPSPVVASGSARIYSMPQRRVSR